MVNKIEQQLQLLKQYSERNFSSSDDIGDNKKQKISTLMADTKDRINRYKKGDKAAFNRYMEDNQGNINVLKQNRTSARIWSSIAFCLVPLVGQLALMGGLVQLTCTTGNQFLFWKKDGAKSGKYALEIQENIQSIDNVSNNGTSHIS